MKKLFLISVFAVLFFSSTAVKADEIPVKLFSGIGWGTSEVEKLNVTLGCELILSDKISVIGAYEHYFSAMEKELQTFDTLYEYRTKAHVAGLYLKYKIIGSFFVRSGLIHSWLRQKKRYTVNSVTVPWQKSTEKGVGISGGFGMDIPIGNKISSQLGLDVYVANGYSWMRAYGTIGFRII